MCWVSTNHCCLGQSTYNHFLWNRLKTSLAALAAGNHSAFLTFSQSIPKTLSYQSTGLGSTPFKITLKSAYFVWQNFLPTPRIFHEIKEGGCLKLPLKPVSFYHTSGLSGLSRSMVFLLRSFLTPLSNISCLLLLFIAASFIFLTWEIRKDGT